MRFSYSRRLMAPLRHTPLHPQWLIFRHEATGRADIAQYASGIVLDVGCGRQEIRSFLRNCRYVGLDYYQTATEWYHTQPNVFADAQALPFGANSVDTLLLLDVLEHLPDPQAAMSHAHRVLKPNGRLIVQVPFLYPLHDTPLDFQRWTLFGLRQLGHRHNFRILAEKSIGTPVATAVLLRNLALSHQFLRWLEQKNPLALLVVFLPLIILASNLGAFCFTFLSSGSDFMPAGYRLVFSKEAI